VTVDDLCQAFENGPGVGRRFLLGCHIGGALLVALGLVAVHV